MVSREEFLQLDIKNQGVPKSIGLDTFSPEVFEANRPKISNVYDPYLSKVELDELMMLANDQTDVIIPWLYSAGMRVEENAAIHFQAKPDFPPDESYFHGTFHMFGKRVSARAIPTSWAEFEPRLGSPFRGYLEGGELVISVDVLDGVTIDCGSPDKIAESDASCLQVVAYLSKGETLTKDASITVNPIQSCQMRCRFCRRQYDSIDQLKGADPDFTLDLVALQPAVMATHLLRRYPDMDWSSKMQVSFVTGAFLTPDHMVRYLDNFARNMKTLTNGEYDPQRNESQNIHVSTHLARDRETMLRLKEVGVHSVQDTIEIIDNKRRQDLMPKAHASHNKLIGKGEISFEDCLRSIDDGLEVFGPDGYYGALVLGLDTYADTVSGLQRLRQAGLERIDASIY